MNLSAVNSVGRRLKAQFYLFDSGFFFAIITLQIEKIGRMFTNLRVFSVSLFYSDFSFLLALQVSATSYANKASS